MYYNGMALESNVEDERMALLKKSMSQSSVNVVDKLIKAPMPGLIVAIEVETGQHIKKGDGVIIIEAMKMENEIKAPYDAIIKEINIVEKQAVEKNQVLVIFE